MTECYDLFMDIYKEVYNSSFPLVTKTCKHKKHEPWMTQELLDLSKKKTKLNRRKVNKPTLINIEDYKTFNNNFNKMRRSAKQGYYQDLLIKHKHDMKRTWATLNEAIGRKIKSSNVPSHLVVDDVRITNQKDIADKFNEYFINAGKKIINNIPKVSPSYMSFLPHPNASSMFIEPADLQEVATVILKIKAKKSAGFDEISCQLLKLSAHIVIEPLTHIIILQELFLIK